jgi:hypothetical protein
MERLHDYTQELKHKQALRTTARIFKCLVHGQNDPSAAAGFAMSAAARHWADREQVHRVFMTAIGAMTTSSDGSFVGITVNDLLPVVRPMTIVGRLQGLRRVPFSAALSAMSGGTSGGWIGEGKPAPVSKLAFTRLASPLGILKTVALCVEDIELLRSSDPDSELTVSQDFVGALIQVLDSSFIDPASASIAGVRPSSVTNSAPAFGSTGSTAAAVEGDLVKLVESLLSRGSTLQFAVWVIHPVTATFLARLRTTNGDRVFEDVSVVGGMLLGLPVIVSASTPHIGSPSTASIVLLDASRVWYAEDSTMQLSISRSAAIQMADNPSNDSAVPTATTLTSMFQTGTVALRATQARNWRIADSGFCSVLNNLID